MDFHDLLLYFHVFNMVTISPAVLVIHVIDARHKPLAEAFQFNTVSLKSTVSKTYICLSRYPATLSNVSS